MSLARTAASRSLRLGAHALRLQRCAPAGLLAPPHARGYAAKNKKKGGDDAKHTKAAVNTADLVPLSQRILAGDVYFKAEDAMKEAVEKYRKSVAALETRAVGRVTPAMLDPVRVSLPGAEGKVRLTEVATVGVREGTTFLVTVFEEHTLKAVEHAIYDAKLPGIVPQRMDSRTLKIPIPKPTVEARLALYTTAQRSAEDTRVHVRKQHTAAIKKGNFAKRSQQLDELQGLCDKYIGEVDKILAEMKKSTGAK